MKVTEVHLSSVSLTFGLAVCVCLRAFAQTAPINAGQKPAQSFLEMGGINTIPQKQASPHFAGRTLPEAPQQRSLWVPPESSLPTNYVTATALLFEQGLADPRGCDYRNIEVGTGYILNGDGGVVKTRGWLLPVKGEQRFAVCWNGLVYPVVTVGEGADWRADARTAILKVALPWSEALPEGYEVSYETSRPLKGCLLLRLGEAGLAEEYWQALQASNLRRLRFNQTETTNSSTADTSKLSSDDPYLNWASDWAWSLFERSVCAHMRGDDGLALASASLLSAARPKIETAAEQRGFKRRSNYTTPWDGKYLDYLPFLGPLSALQADQERRATESRPLLSSADIAAIPDQTKRVSAWIQKLDQVAVRQSEQPGGLGSWETDPYVQGLLNEGTNAIEPLLQCLESSCADRLTRSVSFGRDFMRRRTLHPVSDVIVDALLKLMSANEAAVGISRSAIFFGKTSNTNTSAQFRAFWKEFGQLPMAERWYRKLADDQAGQDAWGDSLSHIVRAKKLAGSISAAELEGESLRSRTGPSVTELLMRRGETIVTAVPAHDPFGIGRATDFLITSERWEAPAQLVEIACKLQDKVMAAYDGIRNIGSADPQKAVAIAQLAMLRGRHGDTGGLMSYAQWIPKSKPAILESSVQGALEPFWQFPRNPSLRAAAESMFGNTNSVWGSLAWVLDARGRLLWEKPLASPLLIIPELRALVVAELNNRSPGGEAVNRGEGNLDVRYANGGVISYGLRKGTEGLEKGATFPFRRCDAVAEQLSRIPGFPQMSFLWPETKRDEAVAAAIKLLSTAGNRLRAKEKPEHGASVFDPPLVEISEKGK